MHNAIPSKIETFVIQKSILDKTISELQRIGLDNKEGIVYWIGNLNGDVAKINEAIFAGDYPEFENHQYYAKVPLESSFKIAEKIHQSGKLLFVQVHSHPADAFHSPIDNARPISHRVGLISLVVPYFGQNVVDLSPCKIYEYEGKGNWHKITSPEKEQRFIMEDDD